MPNRGPSRPLPPAAGVLLVCRRLARPLALAGGVLMAAYLLGRPYGDASSELTEVARAFASPLWVAAHVAGAASLVLTASVMFVRGGRFARVASVAGTALVLPYYGAETFALNVIGGRVLAGEVSAFGLVDAIRNHPVALVTFAAGLLLLAVGGVAAASRRGNGALRPLAVVLALVLPQYFLPPVGRMAFGVAYLLAAMSFAVRGDRPSGAIDAGRKRVPLDVV